ncbi:ABC transporter permease [Candidatus Venteria ishoeyi]|uniref:ABC transporter permease n=1 Tax=Candidatus Venteria ishoeyi TaxID=1899563 RepID=UPI0025A5C550|nr:ABC transporter permease [Candidatus Venteria ishoeyi]MDM8548067.1 ABC transporter permease [Candidatus Venteria ishoeyi]
MQNFWSRLKHDHLAMLGLILLILLSMTAFAGKALTEWSQIFDPATVRLVDKFRAPMTTASTQLAMAERPPFGIYFLGTDELGRDVFARMLQGSFVSLSIGFIAVGIATLVGVLLGGLAGYYHDTRWGFISLDGLIMRFTDVMLCFPSFFLILTVVALLPPNIYNIMIVIGLTSWMGTARFVRAEFLSLKQRDFIRATQAVGLPEWRIIFLHMFPNALTPVMVTAVISVAGAILTESALSFLGFGVQPPDATWGNILSDGKAFIFDAPWLFFIPGFTILVVVLAFNLLGEGLREAMQPEQQG